MAMHTVKTEISVIEMNNFKMFLQANNIRDIVVGMHQKRANMYQLDNYIEYSYSDREDDATMSLTYMELKYGGLESAFKDFLRKIDRMKLGGSGLGYIDEHTY